MTTQEIKALVAAKIAGQGNQVDLGNALSDIFDSLCDLIDAGGQGGTAEPLIIEGVYDGDSGTFVPNPGQPRFAEAISAINSGKQVYLSGVWEPTEPESIANLLVIGTDTGGLYVYDPVNSRVVLMYDE